MKDYSPTIFSLVTYEVWCNLQAIDFLAMMVKVGDTWLAAAKASHKQGLLGEDRRLHQLLHLVTHGTHHRGQLLSMITLMGYGQPFEGGDFGGWSGSISWNRWSDSCVEPRGNCRAIPRLSRARLRRFHEHLQ